MKRIWLIALAAALMLTMSGCADLERIWTNFAESIRLQLEDNAEDFKQDVSEAVETFPEKVGEVAEGIAEDVEEEYQEQRTKYTITFVTGEGSHMEPATVEKWWGGLVGYKVSKLPVLTNHHFLGWATEPEITRESKIYTPKEYIKVEQDMTLYAVWMSDEEFRNRYDSDIIIKYPSEAVNAHDYQAKLDKEWFGPFKSVASVTVKCDCCGMELNNPLVSRDDFDDWCKADDDIDRMYVLYIAKEYGPATLDLMTRFRTETVPALNMEAVEGFDTVEELLDEIGSDAENASLYGQLVSHFPTSKGAAMDAAAAEEFLNDLSESTGNAAELVSIVRTCCYFAGSLDPQQGIGDRTVYMLETLDPIIACAPAGSYYTELLKVLKEGIKLWDECQKHESEYHEILAQALENGKNKLNNMQMSYYIPGDYMSCLERAANGHLAEDVPTAMEVIDRINQNLGTGEIYDYSLLGEQERRFIAFYITEYLDWQFRLRTEVSLETYIEYLQE